MSASPMIASAFEAWMFAELASHYAAPCPEDVMSGLVDQEHRRFNDLMEAPVESADDMLLKVFPILLRELEPKRGEPPLCPSESTTFNYEPSIYERLIEGLGKVSPALRLAMEQPAKAGSADNG